jgi:hypothetical protein
MYTLILLINLIPGKPAYEYHMKGNLTYSECKSMEKEQMENKKKNPSLIYDFVFCREEG